MSTPTSKMGPFLGFLFGVGATLILKPSPPQLLAPAADTKVAAAYTKNGFGNVIMSSQRRKGYSKCYENFVTSRTSALQLAKSLPDSSVLQEDLAPEQRTEGALIFVFHVRESGELQDFDLAIDELHDATFTECIKKALTGIRFTPPPLGINRYISYEMNFKTEETLKKEREQKANQAPYTLVPTPNTPDQNSSLPTDQAEGGILEKDQSGR